MTNTFYDLYKRRQKDLRDDEVYCTEIVGVIPGALNQDYLGQHKKFLRGLVLSRIFHKHQRVRRRLGARNTSRARSVRYPNAAGIGMPLRATAAMAPHQGTVQLEQPLKKLMILLLLSGCVPPPGQYSYYYHSYGIHHAETGDHADIGAHAVSGHYADEYTYAKAQGTLDNLCELPLVDINRILRSDPERAAKEVICQKDSLNRAVKRVRTEVAKKEKSNISKTEKVNISRSEKIDDTHYFNEGSPNTEGGSSVYIDVNHGHAE